MFHAEACLVNTPERSQDDVKTIYVIPSAWDDTYVILGPTMITLNKNDAYALALKLLQSVGRSVILS